MGWRDRESSFESKRKYVIVKVGLCSLMLIESSLVC